ncbi:hypothetical protein BU16DRAFT_541416 [Lophium mytilinum]|uniref:Uncharacterized protein n=1 Tax=Lophium mytilinum TaxID=390894 RepID=A0A6A6QKG4_9PEZI|nr:hypothetical protein BU16DRAFT_541416 [Lophium mytilinum]
MGDGGSGEWEVQKRSTNPSMNGVGVWWRIKKRAEKSEWSGGGVVEPLIERWRWSRCDRHQVSNHLMERWRWSGFSRPKESAHGREAMCKFAHATAPWCLCGGIQNWDDETSWRGVGVASVPKDEEHHGGKWGFKFKNHEKLVAVVGRACIQPETKTNYGGTGPKNRPCHPAMDWWIGVTGGVNAGTVMLTISFPDRFSLLARKGKLDRSFEMTVFDGREKWTESAKEAVGDHRPLRLAPSTFREVTLEFCSTTQLMNWSNLRS